MWDVSGAHLFYLINFKDSHERLSNKMIELRSKKDYVKRRIRLAELDGMTHTSVVDGWLQRVVATDAEVDLVLQEGSRQIQRRCIGDCCLQNWCACYQLGKKMSKTLTPVVVDLIREGDFGIVADRSLPAPVEVKQESQTVGMDALFNEVWQLLEKDEVKMMGIYGMGGVGKTTLLKRVNNSFYGMHGTFDAVIWVGVGVSKLNIPKVQEQIADRLGLTWSEDFNDDKKAKRILDVLSGMNFVVLLDDIWERIELEAIGIPSPRSSNYSSKVVFTTRSESVCGSMEVDEKVQVHVLGQAQAWTLFQQKVGQEALSCHPEIPQVAEKVVRKCGGLPLALITIGRAMAAKKTLPEWNYALKTLKKYASDFSGMEKVLATLKFSYDNLEDDNARSLFLYFSLYPRNYEIAIIEILGLWAGEKFVDVFQDVDDIIDMGYDIIGSLKAACLLESVASKGYVSMHDLISDLALWIGCECGKKKNNHLVQTGFGLTRAPDIESWNDAQRISIMYNHITELPKPPHSPYLLSLMLRNNPLSSITTDFFADMPSLRVLDLSKTKITNVPKSLCGLVELQYLNLSSTCIPTLPVELANLRKLRLLNLNNSPYLNNIPGQVISQFSRLQVLGFYEIGFKGEGNICLPNAEELKSLENLRRLEITIQDFETLKTMCFSPIFSSCIYYLSIYMCQDLTQLELAPASLLRKMKTMEGLSVNRCLELEEVTLDCSKENQNNMGLLWTLEFIEFHHLPKLNILWTGENITHLHFKNLRMVTVINCAALKDLSWLVLAPVLSDLTIERCKKVEEILVNGVADTTIGNQVVFSRLETFTLEGLPNLESISRVALAFSSLKTLTVNECPLLKMLPFTSTATMKPSVRIYGSTRWWNELLWEDEAMKSSFQHFFRRY